MSQDEFERKSRVLDKRSWVDEKDFNVFGKTEKSSLNTYIPNYVTRTPSQNPSLHKFRETEKQKWISGPFIIS